MDERGNYVYNAIIKNPGQMGIPHTKGYIPGRRHRHRHIHRHRHGHGQKKMSDTKEDTIRIAAIDIGYENMALGVSSISFFRSSTTTTEEESTIEFPHLERTSLRICRNGNFYAKYQEGIAVELVEAWLADHWYLLCKVDLIVIEKQMTKNRGQSDRAGIVLETAMKMALRREPGGPAFVVISPKSYKDNPQLGLRGAHNLNKRASVDLFRQQCPKEIFDRLQERNFGKMDDIADVYHMLAYTSRNIASLMTQSRIRSSHTSNVKEPNKARVYRRERETTHVHFTPDAAPEGSLTVDERNFHVHRHALERKHLKQQSRAKKRASSKNKTKERGKKAKKAKHTIVDIMQLT